MEVKRHLHHLQVVQAYISHLASIRISANLKAIKIQVNLQQLVQTHRVKPLLRATTLRRTLKDTIRPIIKDIGVNLHLQDKDPKDLKDNLQVNRLANHILRLQCPRLSS